MSTAASASFTTACEAEALQARADALDPDELRGFLRAARWVSLGVGSDPRRRALNAAALRTLTELARVCGPFDLVELNMLERKT